MLIMLHGTYQKGSLSLLAQKLARGTSKVVIFEQISVLVPLL